MTNNPNSARPALRWFVAACILGVVHAAFSGYWALGGGWMLGTVGSWAVEWVDTEPATARSILAALTAVKLAAAVLPLVALLGRVPLRRTIFAISWAGSAVLILRHRAGRPAMSH